MTKIASFDLNLRHLRALAAIVTHGSMTAAAEAVSLSQPALTQGLAKLERQLAVRLFDRQWDGVIPTAQGVTLADRTGTAFAHLARVTRETRVPSRPEYRMTATQLRAFLALADAGSYAGAAVATDLSRSALHRAVRDLEQICALTLVERRGRGIALTIQGRRVARGVRLAAKEIAAALAEIRPDLALDGNRIVVGAMPLCRAVLLPRSVAALASMTPLVTVDIVEGAWRELIEPLRDGEIDLMIGALRPEVPSDLEQRQLFVDRMVVVARAGHPLAGRCTPTLDELSAFPWVVGREGTPLRLQWQALFGGRPLPHAPIECGSLVAIRGILLESDFLTLLSPAQIAIEVGAGILTAIGPPLADSVRSIGITSRAGWRPTATQRLFLELIEAQAPGRA